jgi:hypothetical protein
MVMTNIIIGILSGIIAGLIGGAFLGGYIVKHFNIPDVEISGNIKAKRQGIINLKNILKRKKDEVH